MVIPFPGDIAFPIVWVDGRTDGTSSARRTTSSISGITRATGGTTGGTARRTGGTARRTSVGLHPRRVEAFDWEGGIAVTVVVGTDSAVLRSNFVVVAFSVVIVGEVVAKVGVVVPIVRTIRIWVWVASFTYPMGMRSRGIPRPSLGMGSRLGHIS